jgi:acetyl-CoA decarbonylase/synthase complex subunit gamma
MPEKATLLGVYKFLPQTNCGECGEVNCMSFASLLLERKAVPENCPPLKTAKYRSHLEHLSALIAPPVKEVVVGVGERAVKIGGKEVMYRHELRFHNPAAIAIDVSDTWDDAKIAERCKSVEAYEVQRIGQKLKLDMVAVRYASGVPEKFVHAVSVASKSTSLPLILCCFEAEVMRSALEQKGVHDVKPLLYAATKDNWKDMGYLAKQYSCPIVAYAPLDIQGLKSLAATLKAIGVQEIVLDPGTFANGKQLMDMISNLTMLRRSAIQKGDKDVGYPIMGVPAVVWMAGEDPTATSFKESVLAASLVMRYADLIIMHTMEPWALLPIVTLRQNIYTDPVKPVAVEAGLRAVGNPDETSPVLITTNFALTYFTVLNDLETAGITCHLIGVDTGGLAVECSVAGGQFNAALVRDALASTKIEEKVKHRKLIVPGMTARLRGDLEDTTKWEILVGPKDSSQIKDFLKKVWVSN